MASKWTISSFIGCVSIFLLGFFFPNAFWTTHFIYFLPTFFQISLGVGVTILSLIFYFNYLDKSLRIKHLPKLWPLYSAILIGVSLFYFPMVVDFYGDSFRFKQFLEQTPSAIPDGVFEKLYSYKLGAWSGEETILSIITYVAYWFQISYKYAFYAVNTLSGFLFSWMWLHIVNTYLRENKLKFIFSITLVSAPFMLLFLGHFEIYAVILCFNMAWAMVLLSHLKKPKPFKLAGLILVTLLCIKLHLTGLLLLVPLIISIAHHNSNITINWKTVGLYLGIPILLAGAIIYFFVFEDHHDDRSIINVVHGYDHLFLPLFTPDAPLDTYNLLSFNHIFDYGLLWFLWSPVAVFLVLSILLQNLRTIFWNNIYLISFGSLFILYVLFFFMINPLLSMPIDWDLFCIPAPFLLLIVLLLFGKSEIKVNGKPLLYFSLILALLSSSVFVMHQYKISNAKRLQSLSIRIYTSYYEWSARLLEQSVYLDGEISSSERLSRDYVLEALEPYAREGIDFEYSKMLKNKGRDLLRAQQLPAEALPYFSKSRIYNPEDYNNLLLITEAYFVLEDFDNAYKVSEELMALKFPSEEKALRLHIHIALESAKYNEALKATTLYLKRNPSDELIQHIHKRLLNKDNVTELKDFFKRSN